MLDQNATLQGVGLYAEFQKNEAVAQLLVTPDGYTVEGDLIGIATIRRVLTKTEPDRAWGITVTDPLSDIFASIPSGGTEAYAEERFKESTTLLDQYTKGGWTAVGPAFLIEVSNKDMTDISNGRAPSKLLYRVAQCKNALGYPDVEDKL